MKAVHTLLIGLALPLLLAGCADIKAPTPVPTQCFGEGCSNENVVQANLASQSKQINVPLIAVKSPNVVREDLGEMK